MAEEFPGKVLLIDDDPDIGKIYGQVLTNAGYSVEFAQSGREGYAKILQGGYDLILLDLVMPDLDGISILKKLKQKHETAALAENIDGEEGYNGPVIVLSQMDQPQLIETAYSLGAKGYLIKAHIIPSDLPSKISEILSEH